MDYTIKHDLSPELAHKAAQKAADYYTEKWAKYNAQTNWVGEDRAEISFRVKGVDVAATLDMQPGQIVVGMQKVPLLLRPFKKQALDVVQRTMTKWIEKAKNGELDG
ncbi:MAG: polyhydroxyalkanoic acid system family protein [Polyangiales bacterium]